MKNKDTKQRPKTAAEVASLSFDEEGFGRAVRDWQHELRNVTKRSDLEAAFANRPVLLLRRLGDVGLADAYLAAYVEHVCKLFAFDVPEWVYEKSRYFNKVWFAQNTRRGRARLLLETPYAFRSRQLFTVPDVPFHPRAGRPSKNREEINKVNALRQKRYRDRKQLSAVMKKG